MDILNSRRILAVGRPDSGILTLLKGDLTPSEPLVFAYSAFDTDCFTSQTSPALYLIKMVRPLPVYLIHGESKQAITRPRCLSGLMRSKSRTNGLPSSSSRKLRRFFRCWAHSLSVSD